MTQPAGAQTGRQVIIALGRVVCGCDLEKDRRGSVILTCASQKQTIGGIINTE